MRRFIHSAAPNPTFQGRVQERRSVSTLSKACPELVEGSNGLIFSSLIIIIILFLIGAYLFVARDRVLVLLPKQTQSYLYFNTLPLTASGFYNRHLTKTEEIAKSLSYFLTPGLKNYQEDFKQLITTNKNQLVLTEVRVADQIEPLIILTTSCSRIHFPSTSTLAQWPKKALRKNLCLISPEEKVFSLVTNQPTFSFQNAFSGLATPIRKFSLIAVYYPGSEIMPNIFTVPLKEKITLGFQARQEKVIWQSLVNQDLPGLDKKSFFKLLKPIRNITFATNEPTWVFSAPDFNQSILNGNNFFVSNELTQQINQVTGIIVPELINWLEHQNLKIYYFSVPNNGYLLTIDDLSEKQLEEFKTYLLKIISYYYPTVEEKLLPDETLAWEYQATPGRFSFQSSENKTSEILNLPSGFNLYLSNQDKMLLISNKSDLLSIVDQTRKENDLAKSPTNLIINLEALKTDLPFRKIYLEQLGEKSFWGIFIK